MLLTHGNKNRKKKSKISDEVFFKIADDYIKQNQYLKDSVSFKHTITFKRYYYDNVFKKYKISKAQFYRKILDLGICSQFASKKTKRATKKILKNY